MRGRICIYYKSTPDTNRFFPGDKFLKPIYRGLLNRIKIGSIERVFLNLCKSFDERNIKYRKNLPFSKLKDDDVVIVLGLGKTVLNGYQRKNKIIAGIGLMTHPAEWPTIFKDFPIAIYLQHSEWTSAIYKQWYGADKCTTWPAGIDTDLWKPIVTSEKKYILIYVKFLWDKQKNKAEILQPIIQSLEEKGLDFKLIEYGDYKLNTYKKLLKNAKGMIFLAEHESQGLAYQEAMSMDIPILAYDQGLWLDPNRFEWNEKEPVAASSVPFFDERCGEKFNDISSYHEKLPVFLNKIAEHKYAPRQYILENLSLAKSGERMLELINITYGA